MTREPRSLVRIRIYRTRVIRSYAKFSLDSLHRLNDTWAPRRLIAERKFLSLMSLLLLLPTVTCALRRSNRLAQKTLSLNWRTSKTLLRYEWKNCIAPCKESKTVLECGLHMGRIVCYRYRVSELNLHISCVLCCVQLNNFSWESKVRVAQNLANLGKQ